MLPLVATVGYCVRTLVRTYDPFRVLSMLGGRYDCGMVARACRSFGALGVLGGRDGSDGVLGWGRLPRYLRCFFIHSRCPRSVRSLVQCSLMGVMSASFSQVRVFHTA